MKRTKSLYRLVTAISLIMAAVLFNFSVSAEPKLSEPIAVEKTIFMLDLDMKIESSPGQKIKYRNFYSIEFNDLIFNDIYSSNFNDSKQFDLALLTQPTFYEISGIYKTDILNFYQDPDIRLSKNYEVLKVAMRSYSF